MNDDDGADVENETRCCEFEPGDFDDNGAADGQWAWTTAWATAKTRAMAMVAARTMTMAVVMAMAIMIMRSG